MEDYNRGPPPPNPQSTPFLPNYLQPLPPEAYANGLYQPGEMPLGMPLGVGAYDMMFPDGVQMGQPQDLQSPAMSRPMQTPYSPVQQPPIPAPEPESPQGVPKQKSKRRSKNDINGRDYRCGCGKTYLSYPALYTHIKTKHNGQNPPGTPMFQSCRGRGRPRKVD